MNVVRIGTSDVATDRENVAWLLRDKGKENGYIATYEHDGPYLWGVGANDKRGIRPALYISKRYFTN